MTILGGRLGDRMSARTREDLDLVVRAESRFGFVDLTEAIQDRVRDAGLVEGACAAFCLHTTCALIVNEWEAGAQEDFRRRLRAMFPPDDYYLHDDVDLRTQNLVPGERSNGHAHVMQMLMGGTSITLPVRDGLPLLGRWQRVALVELDHPKDRLIALQMLGSPHGPPAPYLRDAVGRKAS